MAKNQTAQGVGLFEGRVDTDKLADAISEHRENHQASEPDEPAIEGEVIDEDSEAKQERFDDASKKFTEKKIRNLIKAPFELWFLKTGCEGVRIKDGEVDLILEDTVDILNAFVKINPLWLAGIGLTVNGSMIFMNKLDNLKKFNAEKAEQKKNAEASK